MPERVFAQNQSNTVTDAPRLAEYGITHGVTEPTKMSLVGAIFTAIVNLLTFAANRLAYDAAVMLASGGADEQPLIEFRSPEAFFADYTSAVAGEAIGQLNAINASNGVLTNFNLCAPDAQIILALKLGIKSSFRRPEPRCDFNEVKTNWKGFLAQVAVDNPSDLIKNEVILLQLKDAFDPQVNQFSVGLQLYSDILGQSKLNADIFTSKLLMNGPTKDVVDVITGNVKTPASMIDYAYNDSAAKAKDVDFEIAKTVLQNTDTLLQVGVSMLSVFANTLLSSLTDRLYTGLFDFNTPTADPFDAGMFTSSNRAQAQQRFQSILSVAPLEVTNYNVLADFSSCPSNARGLYNCVVDTSFVTAVARASAGVPMTLSEAVDDGLIDSSWPLISSTDSARDQDPYCYTYGFCHSNLVKLRKARIISIGWELAAESGGTSTNDPVTLQEVMDGFYDCNTVGELDANHPWCKLIDPDWVLKYPDTQCRQLVYGQLTESAAAATRKQECVDSPSCIDEDSDGNCTGGYGYCVREANVWNFRGDACPEYAASCLTFTDPQRDDASYLLNTVDYGTCDEGNAGCLWYATQKEEQTDGTFAWPTVDSIETADAESDAYKNRLYLTAQVSDCDEENGRCSELVERDNDLRLNAIVNPSFEDDAETDGVADAWTYSGTDVAYDTSGTYSLHGDDAVNPGASALYETGITMEQGRTYTLSYYARQEDGGTGEESSILIAFDNDDTTEAIDVRGTAYSGDCALYGSARNILEVTGTPSSTTYERYTCTLTSPILANRGDQLFAYVRVNPANVWVDDLQLEQGEDASAYHEGYSTSDLSTTVVKVPPAYLGCTGNADTDSAGCANYAAVCLETEVGCTQYSPSNGDPDVFGITDDNDVCPSACVGYDTFKQEATLYEPNGDFPVYFIPSTAEECSAEEVGCDEFTKLDDESLAYFTYVRACLTTSQADANTGGDQSATFYTWEGSDLDGYQLKTWNLMESNMDGYTTATYTTSGLAETNPGHAPCTSWTTNGSGVTCDDDVLSAIGDFDTDSSDCDEHDDIFSNPSCREFYDTDGNIHYRDWSLTVTVNNACTSYRKTDLVGLGDDADSDGTDDGNENCTQSGGYFDAVTNECRYYGFADESVTCDESAHGCRNYTGGRSRNSSIVLEELFEDGDLTNWDAPSAIDVTYSNESIATDGHSLASTGKAVWTYLYDKGTACAEEDGCAAATTGTLGGNCTVENGAQYCGTIIDTLVQDKTYTLTFWAKGTGDITAGFALDAVPDVTTFARTDAVFDTVTLSTSSWQKYTLGPLNISSDRYETFGDNTVLAFIPESGVTFYVDNITLRQGEDNITLIKDSWVTPASCDEAADGTASPQYYLGCQEYVTQDGDIANVSSFSALCREEVVGCDDFFATHESESPYAQVYGATCATPDGLPVATATDCYRDAGESSDVVTAEVEAAAAASTSTMSVDDAAALVSSTYSTLQFSAVQTAVGDALSAIDGSAAAQAAYDAAYAAYIASDEYAAYQDALDAYDAAVALAAFTPAQEAYDAAQTTYDAALAVYTAAQSVYDAAVAAAGTATTSTDAATALANAQAAEATAHATLIAAADANDAALVILNVARVAWSNDVLLTPFDHSDEDHALAAAYYAAVATYNAGGTADAYNTANAAYTAAQELTVAAQAFYDASATLDAADAAQTSAYDAAHALDLAMQEAKRRFDAAPTDAGLESAYEFAYDAYWYGPELAAYLASQTAYNTAADDYEIAYTAYQDAADAVVSSGYSDATDTFDAAQAIYDDALAAYNDAQATYDIAVAAYAAFLADVEADDAAEAAAAAEAASEESGVDYSTASYDTTSPYLCTIGVGEASCSFDVDYYIPRSTFIDAQAHLSYGPSTHIVSADTSQFLVVNDDVTCSTAEAGCTELGLPTFSADRQNISASTSVYLINDPASYADILCNHEDLFCQAYDTENKGTFYFKDPVDQTCEYRTDVTISGSNYDGWFRNGGDDFCYGTCTEGGNACSSDADCGSGDSCNTEQGSYVIGGDQSGIWNNGDAAYGGWVGSCDEQYSGCTEFQDLLDIAEGDVYGAVDGESYFYLDNSSLEESTLADAQRCNGQASQKAGCALFHDTTDSSTTSNMSATYVASQHADALFGDDPFSLVDPVDCSSTSASTITATNGTSIDLCAQRCAYPTADVNDLTDPSGTGSVYGASCYEGNDCAPILSEAGEYVDATCDTSDDVTRLENDANRVVKVNRDRQCSEWLTCSDTQTVWDEASNKFKTVCGDVSLCNEYSASGNASFCSSPVADSVATIIDSDRYSGRDVSWYGDDYSGYAIPDSFPVELLTQVLTSPPAGLCDNSGAINYDGTPFDFTTSTVHGTECDIDTDCDDGANPDAVTGETCTLSTETETYALTFNAGSCTESYGVSCTIGYCENTGEACAAQAECGTDAGDCVTGICYDVDTASTCTVDSQCNSGFSCLSGTCVDEKGSLPVEDATCADAGYTARVGTLTLYQSVLAKLGTCVRESCLLTQDGQPFDVTNEETKLCRAHPEANSPFPNEVVEEWKYIKNSDAPAGVWNGTSSTTSDVAEIDSDTIGGSASAAFSTLSGFGNVQLCSPNEDCSCSYKKITYGDSGDTKFLALDSSLDENLIGVCNGGDFNGAFCSSSATYYGASENHIGNEVVNETTCTGGEGVCNYPTRSDALLGMDGYCLEHDTATNIHGNRDADHRACLTWLPVDQLVGSTDLHAKYKSAGFFGDTYACVETRPYVDLPISNYGSNPGDTACAELNDSAAGCDAGEDWTSHLTSCAENVVCPENYFAILGACSWDDATSDNTLADSCVDAGYNDCPYVCVPEDAHTPEGGDCNPADADNDGIADNYDLQTRSGSGTLVYGWVNGALSDVEPSNTDYQAFDDVITGVYKECVAKGVQIDANNVDSDILDFPGTNETTAGPDEAYRYLSMTQKYSVDIYPACKILLRVTDDDQGFAWTDKIYNAARAVENAISTTVTGLAYRNLTLPTPFGVSGLDPNNLSESSAEPAPPAKVATCHNQSRDSFELPTDDDGDGVFDDCDDSSTTNFSGTGNDPAAPDARSFVDYILDYYARTTSYQGIWSTDPTTTLFANLQQVFARPALDDDYAYSWTGNLDTSSNRRYVAGSTSTYSTYDSRAESGEPPKVWSLDLANCEGDTCEEGNEGSLTLNSTDNGEQTGSAFFRAYLKFYAAANENQLPLRRVIVDWQDGGQMTGSTASTNYYKNHRGLQTGSTSSICNTASTSPLYRWGMNSESCDSDYFSYSNIYTCTEGNIATYDSCTYDTNGNVTNSPCTDGTSCVYRPRVHLEDNWGWCSGVCEEGTSRDDDDSTGCFVGATRPVLDSGNDIDSECGYLRHPLESLGEVDPWVYYDGAIVVTP